MQTLHLQLLGEFRLLYNDEPIRMAHLVRQQSLLAYLAIHRDLPQARQHLAFLFWPDASEVRARANLRKTLYDLRRLIPNLEHFVEIDDQFLQWRDSTTTIMDVDLFVASLKQVKQATHANQQEAAKAALERAVALYSGDLWPACYDDWLLLERERLRQLYIKALEELISLLEQRRELAAAMAYAQRLLFYDSLHESTYRHLMRLHLLNGDRASALHLYHSCATLLQNELGVDPSPETQQIYQRLLLWPTDLAAETKPTSPTAKGTLSLVGRQLEWQTLQSAWHAAAAGAARCVLIAGEAGIGKSRLAEELVQWADRQGYATAHTRSYAAEGRLAYAPITEWLRSDAIRARLPELEPVWLVEVARLLPEVLLERPDLSPPAPLTDSWQRQRFREALVHAILLGLQPLLLVIDDLQWCDNETLEWIHYLLRLAAEKSLLVVGTVRSEEVDDNHTLTTLVMNLRHADQLTDIELGLLSSAETATLASQIAGDTFSHDQNVALYTQTEGHPLFVVEILRANEKRGPVSEQAANPASVSLPPKVQAVIQSRLAQLSPSAHELVGLAATVGRAFTSDILALASVGDEDTLVRALDELWQRRLIREQGESSYDFSHDRIREAAYTSVSSARRRLLHRRVAQALEQVYAADLDTISGELAHHYEHANLPEHAIPFYQQAAAVAQLIYAHAEASTYLFRGLRLLEKLPATPGRLQQELKLCFSLATSLAVLKGDSADDVKVVYARALELAKQVGDNPDRFAALSGLFTSNLTQGHLQEAHELAKQRLALAEQLGDTFQRADAGGYLGALYFHLGQWTTCRTLFEQALDRSGEHSFYSATLLPVQHHGLAYQRHLAVALWHLGYPDQALQQMDEALAQAHNLAHPYTSAGVHSWSARLYVYRREAALAQAQAETTIALCLEHGFPFWLEQSNILLGWALAQQGQVEAGIARIHRSLDIRKTMDAHLHKPAFLALLAEAYGQAGQSEQGMRMLDEALDAVEASGERCSEVEIYRLRGELLRIQGADAGEVESHFRQALTIAQLQEAKSLELRVALNLSRLWQQQGRAQEAQALLAEIYSWFSEGFDTADLVEARALLEELS